MPMIFRAGSGWRLMLVALLLILGVARPEAANAQSSPCGLMTGILRSICLKEEAQQRSEASRAQREALAAARRASSAGQADARPAPGANSAASLSRSSPRGSGGVFADPPTIDRSVRPAMLTFVVHPSYSRTPGKVRMPITHGCTGSSYNEELTFNQACRTESLHSAEAALPLFQKSCEEGDPAGCFMYADHIEAKDRATAQAMYVRLCDLGHPSACYRTALAYEKGDGVAKNAIMQRAYYDRACTAGNAYGCSFIAGKVDADCPHGHRGWRADADRKIYKVVCVVDTGPLTTTEHEIPPKPGEIEAIKGMAAGAHTSLPQWWIESVNAKPYDPGCNGNDMQDINGQPIAGSGCIGVHR